jgi:hypothetical protein
MTEEIDDHATMIDQERNPSTMGETDDHATMIDLSNRNPLLPRNRRMFQTKPANQTGSVQVTDGHQELVLNPRNANTNITGKRTERAKTTVVKIATGPEEMEIEIGTATEEEKGMLSARTKVGIEVNERWIGAPGTKTAFETIVGLRQDRMVQGRVQVQGRMVQHHHLVEETVPVLLLKAKVEGMVVHLKEISAIMGVSQTIGVVSRLFGTTDTLHSVVAALLHHVVEGIVVAVKVEAMGSL